MFTAVTRILPKKSATFVRQFKPMSSVPPNELKGWIPWKLSNTLCEWLYTGSKKFTEPFFEETVSVCRNLDENRKPYKVLSHLQVMLEWAGEMDTLVPSTIIFHVSRCGSTLLSQLLGLDETHIVLSEVPFFDELLRLPYKKKPTDVTIASNYLNAAIKYYGQKRSGREKCLFIKTDSWHLHFYNQLRSLFPSVPFILLYRNPLEVILSHQRQRGMQSVPGIIEPEVFGFSKEQVHEPNLDVYMANVLTGYFCIMIEIAKSDPLALPVNYRDGMSSIIKKINALHSLHITEDTEKLFIERSRYHAKHPHQLFTEDYKEFSPPGYLLPVLQLYRQLDAVSLLRHSVL
jgi:hypothetical protein